MNSSTNINLNIYLIFDLIVFLLSMSNNASADIACVKNRRKEKKQAKRLGRPIPVIKKVCFITQLYCNSS